MPIKHYNLARMTTPTTGVGAIALGSAVHSFLAFDRAGLSDGDIVSYAIDDDDAREVGRGAVSAGTLTRYVLSSTNGNLPIDLSGHAQVMLAAAAEDINGALLHTVLNTSGNPQHWDGLLPILPAGEPPTLGDTIWFRPGLASVPGGTDLALNGGDPYPVVFQGPTTVGDGDILPDAWLLLFFDGTRWLIEAGDSRVAATPILTSDIDWYVNGTTGNDSNDGSSAGPFRTIQRAVTETLKYNLMGYTQRVYVADGDYVGPVYLTAFNGVGRIALIGNRVNPAACRITQPAIDSCIAVTGGVYEIDGFQVSSAAQGMDGITVLGNGHATIFAATFGPCGRYHLCVGSEAGRMIINGPIRINAGGNTSAHIGATGGGAETADPRPEIYFLGAVTIANFLYAYSFGRIAWTASQYNPGFLSARSYLAGALGIVSAKGGGIPGTAGLLTSGGQFIP